MISLGIDIGGTKCAVITAESTDGNITFLKKEKCATDLKIPPEEMIKKLIDKIDRCNYVNAIKNSAICL